MPDWATIRELVRGLAADPAALLCAFIGVLVVLILYFGLAPAVLAIAFGLVLYGLYVALSISKDKRRIEASKLELDDKRRSLHARNEEILTRLQPRTREPVSRPPSRDVI